MAHPELEGVESERGDLYDCELWEYLLEKFGHKCFYCGTKDEPLEKEHIIPKAKGGANTPSNLTLSCPSCNAKKGSRHPDEIGGTLGKRVQQALKAATEPMKDAGVVNTIRWKISETLETHRNASILRHRWANTVQPNTSRLTEDPLLRCGIRPLHPH